MTTTTRVFTLFVLILLTVLILSSGCFEEYKKPVLDAISPIVILKGSEQYCIQFPSDCPAPVKVSNVSNTSVNQSTVIIETPPLPPTLQPTVTVEPTSGYRTIDPFSDGERWQGQWYRWTWHNASGLQDANRGIVIYGHSYHNAFTQWENTYGNYYPLLPPSGYRFVAVAVHQEDFGPKDAGLWGYGPSYFHLQYNQQLHEPFMEYNQTNRIIELEDSKSDYYNIDRLRPYGIKRIYIGKGYSVTGGYYIENLYDLRTGQGNSWDGYILYLIPVDITDSDIRIVGNFAGVNVNWRFDRNDKIYPSSVVPIQTAIIPVRV